MDVAIMRSSRAIRVIRVTGHDVYMYGRYPAKEPGIYLASLVLMLLRERSNFFRVAIVPLHSNI